MVEVFGAVAYLAVICGIGFVLYKLGKRDIEACEQERNQSEQSGEGR